MTSDDKIRTGYQAAIALIAYEGQVIWRAFATLLSANTAFTAIAGASLKLFPSLTYASRILAALGLLICVAWFLVLRRQFCYYRYWFAWARHFEKNGLGPEVRITTIGKTYGEGGTIDEDSSLPSLPQFGWTARVFRVEWLMTLIIVVFIVLYLIVLKATF